MDTTLSHLNFELLFRALPAPLLILDKNFNIVTANEARIKVSGVSVEQSCGRNIFEIFPDNPTDPNANGVEKLRASLTRVLETKCSDRMEIQRYDIRIGDSRSGNFETRYWSPINTPILCAEGSVTHIIHRVDDVTDQVLFKNQQALLESERRESHELRELVKLTPIPIAIFRGPEHRYSLVNEAHNRLIGSNVEGQTIREALTELEASNLFKLLDAVYESGEPSYTKEKYYKFSDAENRVREVWLDEWYYPFRAPNGFVEGILGCAQDVTEQVVARRSLEHGKLQLSDAIQLARVGFFDCDLKANVMCFSEQLQSSWGVPAEISFDEVMLLIHSEDRLHFAEQITRAVENRAPYFASYRVVTQKAAIWVEARGTVNYDENGQADRFFGTILDVTHQKLPALQAQDQKFVADIAREQAESDSKTKSFFLAGMSHEIRSPLGAMLGFSAILKERGLSETDRQDYADRILRNGNALMKILDKILDLSKVESGKIDIEMVDFSIRDLISEVIDLFKDKAKHKELSLVLEVGSSIQDRNRCDPTRVRQILINLIGNAIKFTKSGHIKVTASSVNLETGVSRISIDVKDSGLGLTKEQQRKLFRPFAQATIDTTRKFGGTGLGLMLSKELSHALGGDVYIKESAIGVGSTFTLEFNAPEAKSRVASLDLGELEQVTPLLGIKILIADDSQDNLFLVSRLLKKNGAEVDTAPDGESAVEMAMAGAHDVVMMDIQMPKKDGYQAIRELKTLKYPKPIVALTAHAMLEERFKTRDAGFAAHVTKPLDGKQLIDTLVALVSTRH